ncbi:MAG: hypothetical protein V2A61_06550, partial [Calditrichota bacterium]
MILDASLLGEPLPAADEIAVFTPGGMCAGACVWEGEAAGLAAWGDDLNSEPVEGFRVNEVLSFRIWDWDSQTEYRAIPHFVQGDNIFRVHGFAVVELMEGLPIYHWSRPEPTDNNHSLLVLNATLDDENLNTGDEIAAFTPDGILAGWALWPEEGRIGFAAWGDDAQTEEVIEGFRADEPFAFKVWDHIGEAEWDAEAEYIQGPDLYADRGFSVLHLIAYRYRDLEVIFRRDWNMISINVAPPADWYDQNEQRGPNIIRMMADLVNRRMLILMKDKDGRFYTPAFGFNNIPFWNLNEGYQVKTTDAASTIWTGFPIDFDADIPLRRGWNMVAYYPTYELPCNPPDYLAISDILDNVEIAKDGQGCFAVPAYRFSNMPPWRPTQGYQIKMRQEDVLNYPAPEQRAATSEEESFRPNR